MIVSGVIWAVIGALLCTWLDSLIHSMLCAVACWCWKPPPLRLSGDTSYLPPGLKSPRYFGSNQRSPGVSVCSCLKRLLCLKKKKNSLAEKTPFNTFSQSQSQLRFLDYLNFNISPQSFMALWIPRIGTKQQDCWGLAIQKREVMWKSL